MITMYMAGPLFSEAERAWLYKLKSELLTQFLGRIGADINIIFPYELIAKEELDSIDPDEIYYRCKKGLEKSDIVIAVLDGSQVDDGTAWEIGYFNAIRSEQSAIYGIRTDSRKAGELYFSTVNAMIEGSCDGIFYTIDDLVKALKSLIKGWR